MLYKGVAYRTRQPVECYMIMISVRLFNTCTDQRHSKIILSFELTFTPVLKNVWKVVIQKRKHND